MRRKDKRQLERVLNDQMPPLGVEALSEPKNWQIIREEVTDYGSRLFRYLLENRKAFEKKVGEEEVESKIVSVYRNHFRIVKRMCKNFRQPISDLKTLEKEGYPEVKALHYCMLFREIINSEGSGRTREIISALKKLPREFPDAKERRQIAEELTGIEKIATPTQLAEIRHLKANLLIKLPGRNPVICEFLPGSFFPNFPNQSLFNISSNSTGARAIRQSVLSRLSKSIERPCAIHSGKPLGKTQHHPKTDAARIAPAYSRWLSPTLHARPRDTD